MSQTVIDFEHLAVQALSLHLQVPLEQAPIDVSLLETELDDMVDYA